MRTNTHLGYVLILFILVGLGPLAAQELPASPSPDRVTSTSYVVRAGDTFAGIAAREIGDPRAAHSIWKLNPIAAEQPALIEGHQIRLPPRDGWIAAGRADLSIRIFDLLDAPGQSRLVAGRGIESVLAAFLLLQGVIGVGVGALAYWFGAQLAGMFELPFRRAFRRNARATALALFAGMIAWSICGFLLAMLSRAPFVSMPFDELLRAVFGLLCATGMIQFATYVAVLHGTMGVSLVRVLASSFFVLVLHALLVLAILPPLTIAALEL